MQINVPAKYVRDQLKSQMYPNYQEKVSSIYCFVLFTYIVSSNVFLYLFTVLIKVNDSGKTCILFIQFKSILRLQVNITLTGS